jgi:hypothetical protein
MTLTVDYNSDKWQARTLVEEDVPHVQICKRLTVTKIWSWATEGCLTPRPANWNLVIMWLWLESQRRNSVLRWYLHQARCKTSRWQTGDAVFWRKTVLSSNWIAFNAKQIATCHVTTLRNEWHQRSNEAARNGFSAPWPRRPVMRRWWYVRDGYCATSLSGALRHSSFGSVTPVPEALCHLTFWCTAPLQFQKHCATPVSGALRHFSFGLSDWVRSRTSLSCQR